MSKNDMMRSSALAVIPLGGLEQIGMNITAFEYEDSIIVVDCGLAFPEDDMLGIDLVIPDVTYLKDNIKKVNVTWRKSLTFNGKLLRNEAQFKLVPSRKLAADAIEVIKNTDTIQGLE